MSPRKIYTPEEVTGQIDQLLDATGLRLMVPQAEAMGAVMAAVTLAFQDIEHGDARDCQCDPCGRLRASLSTMGELLDVIFGS